MNAGSGWSLNSGLFIKMLIKNNVDNYYAHSRKVGCKAPEYHYKIGVSLLDVGYIRFKENSQNANLSDSLEVGDIEKGIAKLMKSMNQILQLFCQQHFLLQADYRAYDYVYLNAIIVQKLVLATSLGVERSNVFTNFSTIRKSLVYCINSFITVKLYGSKMGLYLRLGYLAIGTSSKSFY